MRDIPTSLGTRLSYRLLEAFSDGGDFSSHHTHLFHGGLVVSQASHKGGGSFDLGQTRQAVLVFKNSTGQLQRKYFLCKTVKDQEWIGPAPSLPTSFQRLFGKYNVSIYTTGLSVAYFKADWKHWLGDWEHLEPMMQQLHSFLLFCCCDDKSVRATFKPSYVS